MFLKLVASSTVKVDTVRLLGSPSYFCVPYLCFGRLTNFSRRSLLRTVGRLEARRGMDLSTCTLKAGYVSYIIDCEDPLNAVLISIEPPPALISVFICAIPLIFGIPEETFLLTEDKVLPCIDERIENLSYN